MKKYFYLHQADLTRGYPRVKWVSETSIPEYSSQGDLLYEYQAEMLPERLIMDDSGVVREPTQQERYELAKRFGQDYIVPVGMYLKDEIVKPLPERPGSLLRPHFDVEQEEWVETAAQEQQDARVVSIKKWTYLDGLGRYGYARLEHALGLVSDDELAEASAYLMALSAGEEATRPAWFSRYMV